MDYKFFIQGIFATFCEVNTKWDFSMQSTYLNIG